MAVGKRVSFNVHGVADNALDRKPSAVDFRLDALDDDARSPFNCRKRSFMLRHCGTNRQTVCPADSRDNAENDTLLIRPVAFARNASDASQTSLENLESAAAMMLRINESGRGGTAVPTTAVFGLKKINTDQRRRRGKLAIDTPTMPISVIPVGSGTWTRTSSYHTVSWLFPKFTPKRIVFRFAPSRSPTPVYASASLI
jgi:hypothetical protein